MAKKSKNFLKIAFMKKIGENFKDLTAKKLIITKSEEKKFQYVLKRFFL